MAKVRVRYKGLSDRRELSVKDLKSVGFNVDKDLVFDRSNLYAMNIDAPDELIALFKREGTFTVSEIKDDGDVGDDIVSASFSDDTAVAATVVNTDTGQRSENPSVNDDQLELGNTGDED